MSDATNLNMVRGALSMLLSKGTVSSPTGMVSGDYTDYKKHLKMTELPEGQIPVFILATYLLKNNFSICTWNNNSSHDAFRKRGHCEEKCWKENEGVRR